MARLILLDSGPLGLIVRAPSLDAHGGETGNDSTALSQKSGSSSGVPGVTRPFQMRRLSPHAVVG